MEAATLDFELSPAPLAGAAPAPTGQPAGMPAHKQFVGQELDLGQESFGELRDSAGIIGDATGLRARMAEDGYLYVRGFFDRARVLAARAEVVRRLEAQGALVPGSDPMLALGREGYRSSWAGALAEENRPLQRLVYGPEMMAFQDHWQGGKARHFDYTWFRAVSARSDSQIPPHCDLVYMSRGTHRLFTAWVPMIDCPLETGGLTILEGSHRQHQRLRPYLDRDVDSYCSNRPDAAEYANGAKWWNGTLSTDPVGLHRKLGGRWLTAGFKTGDLLMFSMHTVHGVTDNASDQFLLSSDSRYQLAAEAVDERWIGEKPIGHGVAGKRGRIC
jgi:hypothetical protein